MTCIVKHTFLASYDAYQYPSVCCFYTIRLPDHLNQSRRHLPPTPHTFLLDKTDGQVSWIGGHSLFQGDQLIHVPLRPHKSTVEELRFRASKPDTEVTRQFLWKIASSAPVRTYHFTKQ
jgi:hypothetical protein